jgi:hypothetical protein
VNFMRPPNVVQSLTLGWVDYSARNYTHNYYKGKNAALTETVVTSANPVIRRSDHPRFGQVQDDAKVEWTFIFALAHGDFDPCAGVESLSRQSPIHSANCTTRTRVYIYTSPAKHTDAAEERTAECSTPHEEDMKTKTCPDCDGDGVADKGTDAETQCPTCGGSGFVPDDDDSEGVLNTSS